MAEESAAQKFLQVEEEVNLLMDQLTQLKQEVEHYSSARESLQDTARQLGETLEKVSALVEGTQNVVAALRDIGTAQILDELASIKTNLDERMSHFNEKLEEISAYQRKGFFARLLG